MEEKSLKELVDEELRAARDRMEAATLLVEHGKMEDAVNRAYYAVFHASRALLYSVGRDAKSHSGLLSSVGLHLIEKGQMEKKYGSVLRRLFEARETADYMVGAIFEEEEVTNMVRDAASYVAMAEHLARENVTKFGE